MNFSNFRHVDRPIFRSQMSRKWSHACCPVPSTGAKAVVPSSWNMRHSGAGPPHSLNQASTSSVFVTIFFTWELLRLTMSDGFLVRPARLRREFNGNVSESNVLAKQVSGRLARRVMDHRSIISLEKRVMR